MKQDRSNFEICLYFSIDLYQEYKRSNHFQLNGGDKTIFAKL